MNVGVRNEPLNPAINASADTSSYEVSAATSRAVSSATMFSRSNSSRSMFSWFRKKAPPPMLPDGSVLLSGTGPLENSAISFQSQLTKDATPEHEAFKFDYSDKSDTSMKLKHPDPASQIFDGDRLKMVVRQFRRKRCATVFICMLILIVSQINPIFDLSKAKQSKRGDDKDMDRGEIKRD